MWARAGKVNAVGIDMKYMVGMGYDSYMNTALKWESTLTRLTSWSITKPMAGRRAISP